MLQMTVLIMGVFLLTMWGAPSGLMAQQQSGSADIQAEYQRALQEIARLQQDLDAARQEIARLKQQLEHVSAAPPSDWFSRGECGIAAAEIPRGHRGVYQGD